MKSLFEYSVEIDVPGCENQLNSTKKGLIEIEYENVEELTGKFCNWAKTEFYHWTEYTRYKLKTVPSI